MIHNVAQPFYSTPTNSYCSNFYHFLNLLSHFWLCTCSSWLCFFRGNRLSDMNYNTDCLANLAWSADILLYCLRWRCFFLSTADPTCVLDPILSVSSGALFHSVFSFIFSIPFPHLPTPASSSLSKKQEHSSTWIIFWFLLSLSSALPPNLWKGYNLPLPHTF